MILLAPGEEVYTVIVCPGCKKNFRQRHMLEAKAKNRVFVCNDCWDTYGVEGEENE